MDGMYKLYVDVQLNFKFQRERMNFMTDRIAILWCSMFGMDVTSCFYRATFAFYIQFRKHAEWHMYNAIINFYEIQYECIFHVLSLFLRHLWNYDNDHLWQVIKQLLKNRIRNLIVKEISHYYCRFIGLLINWAVSSIESVFQQVTNFTQIIAIYQYKWTKNLWIESIK